MELKELLVKLSREDYVISIYPNDSGYNYHIKKLNDNSIGCRFCIVTNKEEKPLNLYWDDPSGCMRYETFKDVYNYLILDECNGTWNASRFSRY